MEKNKKIFVLLPDGVGLRNFVFGDFFNTGKEAGFDITYWNGTPFDFSKTDFHHVDLGKAVSHPLSQIYKNVRKHVELDRNKKLSNDSVYDSYKFPYRYDGIKNIFKSLSAQALIPLYSSDSAYDRLRNKIENLERKTAFYQLCLETLKREKPALVFCSNQRHSSSIAPLLAAKDLNIPTATFIFSWDNLPKATMVVSADYYFVWSDHMKMELLHYYPFIKEEQIKVCGTPQFEPHYDSKLLLSREDFCRKYELDIQKKYLCYSGDDITTSPDDEKYLADLAQTIRNLNQKGANYGLIFRRCPVDFSDRYDAVLQEYKNEIVALNPVWEKGLNSWQGILPTQEDIILQVNTIAHSEMVFNLGSSMVFDYATFGKPCAFVHYSPENARVKNHTQKVYQYVHFKSMPSKNSVYWVLKKTDLEKVIKEAEAKNFVVLPDSVTWFEKIVNQSAKDSSRLIFKGFEQIIH